MESTVVMYSHSYSSLSQWKMCTSFFSLNIFIFQPLNALLWSIQDSYTFISFSLSKYLQAAIRLPLNLFFDKCKLNEFFLICQTWGKAATLKCIVDSNSPEGCRSHPHRFWLNIPRVCRAEELCNKETGVSALKLWKKIWITARQLSQYPN